MFPGFSVSIAGLKPKAKYTMKLDVVLADNHRFKFLNARYAHMYMYMSIVCCGIHLWYNKRWWPLMYGVDHKHMILVQSQNHYSLLSWCVYIVNKFPNCDYKRCVD